MSVRQPSQNCTRNSVNPFVPVTNVVTTPNFFMHRAFLPQDFFMEARRTELALKAIETLAEQLAPPGCVVINSCIHIFSYFQQKKCIYIFTEHLQGFALRIQISW